MNGPYLLLLLAVGGIATSATAAATSCPDPAKLFPGPALGADYTDRRPPPTGGVGCRSADDDGCQFVDRFGIRNSVSGWFDGDAKTPRIRVLFEREIPRKSGVSLPYGVKWSDSYREVLRKLRPYGGQVAARNSRVIWIRGCADWAPNGYWLDFTFSVGGRLAETSLGFQVD